MLVAELDGTQVGLSHVSACRGSRSIWLEGVRVHPKFRRSKIATRLIDEMLTYGLEKGAGQALAIVSRENTASQKMMERSGFTVISEWSFYSTGDKVARQPSKSRLACPDDLDAIVRYLDTSRIYMQSAKKYVDSWHWYTLDEFTLEEFVNEGRVVLSGEPIAGIAVLNKKGYWNSKNILQIVYLDSEDAQAVHDLVAFVTNLYLDSKYERLHVLCQKDEQIISIMEKFEIQEPEQFLLYSKVFSG
jgi:hypothetical protein